MEIEKKFLVRELPENLDSYSHSEIEQGYLNREPVIRIRKMDGDYILTYKSRVEPGRECSVCVNQEIELPLTEKAYEHLKEKADGCLIQKTRYRIRYGAFTVELDLFHGRYEGMALAEVEFPTEEAAAAFTPPSWLGENVSGDYHYSNAFLSQNE